MDEKPTKRRGPLTWIFGMSRRWWIGIAIIMPVLYVASFGVYWRLDSRQLLPESELALWALGIVYAPLFALNHFGPEIIKDIMKWYIRLWVGWDYVE